VAIYHLSVKNGSPGAGGRHAGYILREGRYSDRDDLQATESGNMPAWAEHDPQQFWEAADTYERVNGRPYRELEIGLPRELSHAQRVALVRDFVANTLGKSHAYTWAIHSSVASDEGEQPHVHVMFSGRRIDGIARDPDQYFRRWNAADPAAGGAGKDRYFSSRKFVWDVRNEWAETANLHLERAGLDVRIDARSYREQGLDLEPQLKRGIEFHSGESRGVLADVTRENRERAERNGERLAARPELAIDALTAHQSVFSKVDLQRLVFRNSDSAEQFQAVLQGVLQSPELVALATGKEGEWFTSRELYDIERGVVSVAKDMAGRTHFGGVRDAVQASVEGGRSFNAEQSEAFRLLTGPTRLAMVNGAAGTGKSYVLEAVREAFEREGFQVIGAALQGKTAEELERSTGIQSSTLHRLVGQLDRGEARLDSRSVVVIDEAGLVGSRQYGQLLGHAQRTGATVRLVGDTYQLHAVAAGDALRAIGKETQAAGASAELVQVMRQRHDWQRQASILLSAHRIAEGLQAYQERQFVSGYRTQDEARTALLAKWNSDRIAHPEGTQILLAHTNRERQALNLSVRQQRRDAGELGPDQTVQTATGRLELAAGDRLLFTRNDTGLGVKNGSLGDVVGVKGTHLQVRLDNGNDVQVDTRSYGHVDHGYALTVHKAQGVTVDRAYLMATNTLDAQLTYVAMTRHREAVQVAYSGEHFEDDKALVRTMSRVAQKSFAADFAALELGREVAAGKRQTLIERRDPVTVAAPAQIEQKGRKLTQDEQDRARIDRMKPGELAGEHHRLRRSPAMGYWEDHPLYSPSARVCGDSERQLWSAQDQIQALTDAQKQFQKDFRWLWFANAVVRGASPELERFEKGIKAAEEARKEAESRLPELRKARQEAEKQTKALIAQERPRIEGLIRHVEQRQARFKLQDLAEQRANQKPGFRNGDPQWEARPAAGRELIERYGSATEPERESLLKQHTPEDLGSLTRERDRSMDRGMGI